MTDLSLVGSVIFFSALYVRGRKVSSGKDIFVGPALAAVSVPRSALSACILKAKRYTLKNVVSPSSEFREILETCSPPSGRHSGMTYAQISSGGAGAPARPANTYWWRKLALSKYKAFERTCTPQLDSARVSVIDHTPKTRTAKPLLFRDGFFFSRAPLMLNRELTNLQHHTCLFSQLGSACGNVYALFVIATSKKKKWSALGRDVGVLSLILPIFKGSFQIEKKINFS